MDSYKIVISTCIGWYKIDDRTCYVLFLCLGDEKNPISQFIVLALFTGGRWVVRKEYSVDINDIFEKRHFQFLSAPQEIKLPDLNESVEALNSKGMFYPYILTHGELSRIVEESTHPRTIFDVVSVMGGTVSFLSKEAKERIKLEFFKNQPPPPDSGKLNEIFENLDLSYIPNF